MRYTKPRSNPSYVADATGWVGKCVFARRKHCSAISQQIVDLPISVRSASWFFCSGIVVSLSISPYWYGAEKKRFPSHNKLLDSSHNSVSCPTGFSGVIQAGELAA